MYLLSTAECLLNAAAERQATKHTASKLNRQQRHHDKGPPPKRQQQTPSRKPTLRLLTKDCCRWSKRSATQAFWTAGLPACMTLLLVSPVARRTPSSTKGFHIHIHHINADVSISISGSNVGFSFGGPPGRQETKRCRRKRWPREDTRRALLGLIIYYGPRAYARLFSVCVDARISWRGNIQTCSQHNNRKQPPRTTSTHLTSTPRKKDHDRRTQPNSSNTSSRREDLALTRCGTPCPAAEITAGTPRFSLPPPRPGGAAAGPPPPSSPLFAAPLPWKISPPPPSPAPPPPAPPVPTAPVIPGLAPPAETEGYSHHRPPWSSPKRTPLMATIRSAHSSPASPKALREATNGAGTPAV